MALINCPECGKVISDKADFCVNCGFKIGEWQAQQAAQEAAQEAARQWKDARNSWHEQAAGQPQAAPDRGGKDMPGAKKKKWFIIGGTILFAIITTILLYIFVFRQEAIPTFGLKAGMGQEEILSTMERQGFRLINDGSGANDTQQIYMFEGDAKLFDTEATRIIVINSPSEMTIEYSFESEKADPRGQKILTQMRLQNNLGNAYDKVYQSAKKKLGEPDSTESSENSTTARWEKDKASYAIIDMIDSSYAFYFDITIPAR